MPSRKNGNKWERNRAHQVYDTLQRGKRSRDTYTKRRTRKEERHSITRQCHVALRNPELDIKHELGGEWGCFNWPYVGWPYETPEVQDRWTSRWYRGSRMIEPSWDEIRSLPRWMQFRVQKNLGEINDRLCGWSQWHARREVLSWDPSRKELSHLLEDILHEGEFHKFNQAIKHTTFFDADHKQVGPFKPQLKSLGHIDTFLDMIKRGRYIPVRPKETLWVGSYSYYFGPELYPTKGWPEHHPEWWESVKEYCLDFKNRKASSS